MSQLVLRILELEDYRQPLGDEPELEQCRQVEIGIEASKTQLVGGRWILVSQLVLGVLVLASQQLSDIEALMSQQVGDIEALMSQQVGDIEELASQ